MNLRWILAVALFASGCLQSTYHVERSELERLAQLPAKDRGQSIRATQDLSFTRVPAEVEVHPRPGAVVAEAVVRRIERNHALLIAPRVRARPRGEAWPSVFDSDTVRATPAETESRPAVRVRGGEERSPPDRTRVRTRSGGSGASGDDDGGTSAAAAIGMAVVAAVAVAASVFVVAGIEGTRYDGYLSADADRSIHLYRNDGQWLSIPVYALEPELAEWADGALLDDEDGGGALERLRRAPLDRQGLSLGVEAGVVGVNRPSGDRLVGGGARFSLGGFPIQYLGLYTLLDFAAVQETINIRYGAQLQAFVPPLGITHLGLYGEIGGVGRRADLPGDVTQRDRRLYGGGGLLLQLDINTRVALTFRAGVWATDEYVLPEVTLGLTVF